MKQKRRQLIISTMLAFLTCCSLMSGSCLTEPIWGESGSIMTVLAFAALLILYKKAFFPFEKRIFLVSLPFGFAMGFMIYLGAGYVRDVMLAVSFGGFFAALISLTILFTALLCLFLRALPMISGCASGGVSSRGWGRKEGGFKTWFILFLVTGILYSITFLAVYPGIYSYDASVQVLQFFGGMPVSTHHPLLHTLFLCGCLKLGDLLFGSFQAGMAIHSIIQALLMDALFSYVIWRMIKRRKPVILTAFAFLFLVVNPYMQIFVFITTKDVLFGAAFLLAFLWSVDMVKDENEFFSSRFYELRFLAAVLLMCFLRNQGIYVFLLFAVLFFIYRLAADRKLSKPQKRAGKWAVLALAVTLSYTAVTGPVFAAFGVEKGDVREMLSVPMQQLARAYEEEPEQLSEGEKDYIRELIPPEYLEQYVSVNADPVKSGFQTQVMKKEPGKFFITWLGVGLKTPLVYMDSFFMGNWGYWYPEETQYWINYIVFDGAFMDGKYNVLNIHRDSRFPAYEGYLRNISLTPAFEDVPVLSVLLNQAFPFWLALILAAALIYLKKYRLLLPLLLIFGYWGTLLLGPVTSVRYAFPLMLCVPSLFALLFAPEEPET